MPLVHLFLRLFLCARRRRAGRNLFRERELIRFYGHHGPGAFQTLAAMSGLSTFSIATGLTDLDKTVDESDEFCKLRKIPKFLYSR